MWEDNWRIKRKKYTISKDTDLRGYAEIIIDGLIIKKKDKERKKREKKRSKIVCYKTKLIC